MSETKRGWRGTASQLEEWAHMVVTVTRCGRRARVGEAVLGRRGEAFD
jgi:hypothetical protein